MIATKRRLRVLLAEDQYLVREGARSLLEDHGALEVVGVFADYDSVLSETRRLKPDAVLMDIKISGTWPAGVRRPNEPRSPTGRSSWVV